MHFPTDKCTFPQKRSLFLQKNALSRRKMRLGGGGAHGRKSQEGFRAQESRTLANFHKMISEIRGDSGAMKTHIEFGTSVLVSTSLRYGAWVRKTQGEGVIGSELRRPMFRRHNFRRRVHREVQTVS